MLLWSRCPELRELINHYWERDESGHGGLEIRLDIPGYVMGCICRYLHTGIYSPPCHVADLLQVREVNTNADLDLSISRSTAGTIFSIDSC